MAEHGSFLTDILTKISRRYAREGALRGAMKVGTGLAHDQLQPLRNFFGVDPIRISRNEEVRLHFDRLLQQAPEPFWVERIGEATGIPLRHRPQLSKDEQRKTVLDRLQLAFPLLRDLIRYLQEHPEELKRALANSENETTKRCFQLAQTVQHLLGNTLPLTVSELGAQFFGNSKALRQGEYRALLLRWLKIYAQDAELSDNDYQLLENFHVYHDRLTVNAVLFGPVIYRKHGREFDWIYRLYEQGEAATLNWANLMDVETMSWLGRENDPPQLLCCENEAPFSQLVRQRPGDAVLFTSGFPNSAVCTIYRLLAPRASRCRHWGDSDPNGLRIASILHALFPLQLYRCDIETLKGCEQDLLPLTDRQKSAARAMLAPGGFPFQDELRFTLAQGWLEQEKWHPDQEK
jgi:hypothetical protein